MHLRRNLALLFTANTISNFASGITMLAIPWYLVNLPDSENGNFKAISMMVGVTFVTLFWGLYAGSLIDRYNRKRIFQVLQFSDAVLVGASGLYAHLTGEMPFLAIALVATVTICSWTLFYPNLYAFCQELVQPKYYKQVNSAVELQGQVTNFLGMLVGPILLAGQLSFDWGFLSAELGFRKWSLGEIFLLDAGTYFLSATIISLVKYIPGDYISKSVGSLFSRLKEGFQFLRERPPLLLFGIASHNIFFTLLVFIQVGLALYVRGHLGYGFEEGAVVFGGFEVLYSLGAIVTGLLGMALARLMQRSNLIKQVIFLLALATTVYFTFAITKIEFILYLGAFCVGIANSGARILRITYIIRIAPNHMIGRVNTFFGSVNILFRLSLLAFLLLPFFSAPGNAGNIIWGIVAMGVICALSGLLMVIFFKSFDQKSAYG